MDGERSTRAQRLGIFIAVVEACLFAFVAALHAGFDMTLAGVTIAAPPLLSKTLVEAALALALAVSLILPGRGGARVGHVLVAQLVVVIAVFVGQVAVTHGAEEATARSAILDGAVLVLALASLALLASPVAHWRSPAAR